MAGTKQHDELEQQEPTRRDVHLDGSLISASRPIFAPPPQNGTLTLVKRPLAQKEHCQSMYQIGSTSFRIPIKEPGFSEVVKYYLNLWEPISLRVHVPK